MMMATPSSVASTAEMPDAAQGGSPLEDFETVGCVQQGQGCRAGQGCSHHNEQRIDVAQKPLKIGLRRRQNACRHDKHGKAQRSVGRVLPASVQGFLCRLHG